MIDHLMDRSAEFRPPVETANRQVDEPRGLLEASRDQAFPLPGHDELTVFHIKDREGRYLFVNDRCASLFGKPDRPIVGGTDFDLFPADIAARFRAEDLQVIATGSLWKHEVTLLQRGMPRTYATIKFPVLGPDPEYAGVGCWATDVTDQRVAAERPRQEDSALETLADAIPQMVYMARPDGHLFWCNKHWRDYTGLTSEQLRDPRWPAAYDPNVLPEVVERWHAGIASGDPFDLVFPLRGADATFRTFLTRVSPLKDLGGRVVRWFGICTEITERQRTEEFNARLAAIVDSSIDAIIGKTLAGIVTSWNAEAERLLGYKAEEAIGQHIMLIIPEDRQAEEAEILHQMRLGVRLNHYETVRRRKDGTLVDVSLTISPVRDPTGRVIGVAKIARDITDRKRAEEAQKQAAAGMESLSRRVLTAQEDERRRIARELHDEIGQALTALKINLQRMLGSGEDAAARLEESVTIVDRTLQQVRGMALDLRPSMLDDLGLVAALDWYINRHAERTGLRGQFLADPDNIPMHPELETTCFRVVQEALTNIARHSQASRFSVKLLQHADGLELVVHDNGTGFDPATALRAAARGVSLGLAGMRERVELVGGQIEFRSKAAEGTDIRVRLPNTLRWANRPPE